MPDSISLPRYVCHKTVGAIKITNIDPSSTDGHVRLLSTDNRYGPFLVTDAWFRKHEPSVGGYYVIYDGYQSYSPAQAFEERYSRID